MEVKEFLKKIEDVNILIKTGDLLAPQDREQLLQLCRDFIGMEMPGETMVYYNGDLKSVIKKWFE